MNKEFEKIIEKLEEIRAKKTCNKEKCDTKELCRICVVDDAIEIVKQEAEQYNNAIIDGNYCFQSCACTEKCDKCSRLCNGYIDWYENIDNWTEEYNNGWIPCSERLPEERDWYLAVFEEVDTGFIGIPYIADYLMGSHTKFTTEDGWIIHNCSDREDESAEYYKNLRCVAWKPLPQPYTKGE